MGYEERMDARSDFIAEIIADQEEEFVYIQLYDHSNDCYAILRMKEQDYKKFLEILEEVQKDDNYNLPMLYHSLAEDSIYYECVEPEKVYF